MMENIPERLPAVTNDIGQLTWQELGIGEMMILLEMEFDSRLSVERLARALDLVLDAQPVLGCRIVHHPKKPWWSRLPADARKNFFVADDEKTYENFRIELFPHLTGPQAQACLLHTEAGDRLLLRASHIVCDAGGIKEIAEDIAAIYNRLETEPDYVPTPNLTGSRSWSQLIGCLPWYAGPVIFMNFFKTMWRNSVPLATQGLKIPECAHAPVGFIVRHIPAERVTRLAEYGRARGATLNDILVAAFHRAQAADPGWNRRDPLRLTITVDLRRWHLVTRRAAGICNLSAFEFSNLGTDPGADFQETLKKVSAFFKRKKKNFFGFDFAPFVILFSILSYTGIKKIFEFWVKKGIQTGNISDAFTNMGAIMPEHVTFGGLRPARAWLLPPPGFPPAFASGLSGYSGSLTFSVGCPVAVLPMFEPFMDRVISELPE